MKGELEGLDRQADELDTRISALDREILRLEPQQSDRKEFSRVFGEQWLQTDEGWLGKKGVGTGPKTRRPDTPSSGSSGLQGAWLPETHENSNYILLRIPIEISNSAHGEKAIAAAEAPLSSILPLSPAAITRLQDVRLIRLPQPVRAKRRPIDYAALQQTYRRMLAEGAFSNQAELARHLGVSRVWVSRVLKGIKRKAG